MSASSFAPCQARVVRWAAPAGRGFTLIELMIALVLLGVLFMIGLPTYMTWLQNSQVRAAAESVINGLQLARAEAVRRNTTVEFRMTSDTTAGLSDWAVAANVVTTNPDFEEAVQSRSSAEGSVNARVGISTTLQPDPAYDVAIAAGTGLPASVVFTSVGRVVAGGLTRVDVTSATLAAADTRRLVILITAGGQIRLCDPLYVLATNPQGCA